MAKFLNTSATNYYLEELIKSASDRLILISPFLKINDRIIVAAYGMIDTDKEKLYAQTILLDESNRVVEL